ncbi:hypothetical protein D3C81_2129610 [compost metagenome]
MCGDIGFHTSGNRQRRSWKLHLGAFLYSGGQVAFANRFTDSTERAAPRQIRDKMVAAGRAGNDGGDTPFAGAVLLHQRPEIYRPLP